MKHCIKTFNQLTNKELYDILALRNEVFIVGQNCSYQDCDNKDQQAYHLYFIDKNEIVAYLRILEKGLSFPEISIGRVLVKKTHRNQKLAYDLLNVALNYINEKLKEDTIKISAQEHLKDFYQRLGFKIASKGYLIDNIPHINMVYTK